MKGFVQRTISQVSNCYDSGQTETKRIQEGNFTGKYLSAKENQINLVNRHVKILNHPPSKDSVPCEAIKLSAEPELL